MAELSPQERRGGVEETLRHRVLIISAAQDVRRAFRRLTTAIGAKTEFIDAVQSLPTTAPSLVVVDLRNENPAQHAELAAAYPNVRRIGLVAPEDYSRMVDCLGQSQCDSVLAFDEQFDSEDFIQTATRVLQDQVFGLASFFSGGVTIYKFTIASYDDKSTVLDALAGYAELAGARGPMRARIGFVAEELLMNAVYHAPVDESGKPLYREMDRSDLVKLTFARPVKVECASNGQRFAISATDSYGSLDKPTLLKFFDKATNEILEPEARVSGAGLGVALMLKTASKLVYHLTPGVSTEAIAVFDVDQMTRGALGARLVNVFTDRRRPEVAAEPPVAPRRSPFTVPLIAVAALAGVGSIFALTHRPPSVVAPAVVPVKAPTHVTVSFESTPPMSDVFLAGQTEPLGRTPFSVSLPISNDVRAFEFRLAGYQPTTKQLRLERDASVVLTLAPLKVDPKVATPSTAPKGKAKTPKHKLDPTGVMNPFDE